ncbi:hypothetical protein LTS10_010693 [Elasticomyces elasticus]|nr:hypothetical protein LTS10_010693 [Elasticomyces elasticus]
MASHSAPFRFLALPPELRVRIYECLCEDESQHLDMDLFAIQDFVPNPAILSTSRLIRREALTTTQQAIDRFFTAHTFFILVSLRPTYENIPHVYDIEEAAALLPAYPIATLELRYVAQIRPGQPIRWHVDRLTAGFPDRKVRVAHESSVHGEPRIASLCVGAPSTFLQDKAASMDMALTRGPDHLYWHFGNVVKVLAAVAVFWNECRAYNAARRAKEGTRC